MANLIEERARTMGHSMVPGDGCVEPDAEAHREVLDLRTGSGFLWLSSNGGLVHMNKQGAELLQHISAEPHGKSAPMPRVITQLCAEIGKRCGGPVDSKAWEDFEIRRMCGTVEQPILVRGFCMPGQHHDKRAHVLIILEPIGRRHTVAEQRKERFQLTNREQHIVEHLAKGWTNKEIAAALGISETTVKAHMKHIMDKTRSTTRTGVLAQLM